MLKHFSPVTNGTRHRVDIDRSSLHKGGPEKSLLVSGHLKKQGRGASGHVTVRHRGGGVKKRLRVIDWRRDKYGIAGEVLRIEYDPMRSATLALVQYPDGEKKYMLAPEGLEVGTKVISGPKVEVKPGNAMQLKNIPIGMFVHNIELRPGKGAQMARGAGVAAVLQSIGEKYVTLLLPSKEVRLIHGDCLATIGQVGNQEWKNRKIGKAGRKRLMGVRPTVRGTAQHPDSHPHGGGEGRSPVGMKYPKTPWGKHAHGKKTRSRKRYSNRMIVSRRKAGSLG